MKPNVMSPIRVMRIITRMNVGGPAVQVSGLMRGFNSNEFERYANEFIQLNSDFEIAKGEGVSGLIRKCDWDEIGGNDPQFAPASWDDMDLFLRMHQAGFKFILTGSSVVWHFGARGSHRLEENNGKTSDRQRMSEQLNVQKWIQKWKGLPQYNDVGMITGILIK